MGLSGINSQRNIHFGAITKKTKAGNEYKATTKATTIGEYSGLIAGGLVAGNYCRTLKTVSGKKELLNAIYKSGKKLSDFGAKGEHKAISSGIKLLVTGLLVAGTVIGGVIGHFVDKSTNKKLAAAADKK